MWAAIKSGIGNIWADLTEIEGILTAVLVAQSVVIDLATHAGVPLTVVSNVLGGVSLVSLIIQKVLAARAVVTAVTPPAPPAPPKAA
jgi:hypothetical protein